MISQPIPKVYLHPTTNEELWRKLERYHQMFMKLREDKVALMDRFKELLTWTTAAAERLRLRKKLDISAK